MLKDNLEFISLETLMKSNQLNKKTIKKLLNDFHSINNDVQFFINCQALKAETQPNQKTFFIMNKKLTKIYFYFHIVVKTISLIGFNEQIRKGIITDARKTSAQMILIAQLGRNYKYYSKYITRALMWDYIYQVIVEWPVKTEILKTECDADNYKLIKMYESIGFTLLDKDKTNNLVGLYKKFIYY